MDREQYVRTLLSIRDDVEGERGRLAQAIVNHAHQPGGWTIEDVVKLGQLHAAVLALDAELDMPDEEPSGPPMEFGVDGYPVTQSGGDGGQI